MDSIEFDFNFLYYKISCLHRDLYNFFDVFWSRNWIYMENVFVESYIFYQVLFILILIAFTVQYLVVGRLCLVLYLVVLFLFFLLLLQKMPSSNVIFGVKLRNFDSEQLIKKTFFYNFFGLSLITESCILIIRYFVFLSTLCH